MQRESLLFGAQLSHILPNVCPIDDSENDAYSGVQTTWTLHSSFALIEVDGLVENCVFYENPNGRYCVYRVQNWD